MDMQNIPPASSIPPQAPNIPPPPPKAGPLTKLLLKIAGIDEDLLERCPPRDWGVAKGIGAIGLCVAIYLTSLFFLMTNKLFAPPGQIRIEFLVPSLFFAIFIIVIDAFQINRTSWHLSGIAELKRGGLDISGGPGPRIKAGFFLAIRIMLSIGLAQLTALFVSLLIYGGDINSPIEKKYLEANRHLIGPATALVDAEIQRAAESVTTQSSRVAKLSAQVASLRQGEIDPSANDPQIQQAQQEVEQLIAQKAKADEDVRSAEAFVSNELGGFKGAAPGRGPRYRAAVEQLTNARARAQEITKQLNAARDRLDALRKKIPPPDDTSRQRSHEQRLVFERTLDAENAELSKVKNELAKLTHGRESAIRRAIENAPDHVGAENGFLAQLAELERIAQKDTWIAFIIGLIDVVSFGLELSAVLAKVTSYVPTTYAALLARDAYMQAVRIVDGMTAELKTIDNSPDIVPSDTAPDYKEGNGAVSGPDPFANSNDPPAQPPKRPRGRPRKYPRPNEPLQMPMGEKMKDGNQADQGQ
jgi:hypothetical protein